MTYDPKKHNRRSIRLKGYDYSQTGRYFVTICCQGRAHRFGHIRRGIMALNDPGCMAWHWYERLAGKFPGIYCDELIVMPNHVHFIVEILPPPAVGAHPDSVVGVDPRVHPYHGIPADSTEGESVASTEGASAELAGGSDGCDSPDGSDGPVDGGSRGKHVGLPLPPPTDLPRIVQWYKTMTTNAYIRGVKELGWEPFDRRFWQRNYYEHIIRNEAAYQRIAAYIRSNPQRWAEDKFYQS